MDKIQELHGKLFLHEQSVGEYMKEHASITEDLMGRFAEWAEKEGWRYYSGSKVWLLWPEIKTTEQLIQLFKQTL